MYPSVLRKKLLDIKPATLNKLWRVFYYLCICKFCKTYNVMFNDPIDEEFRLNFLNHQPATLNKLWRVFYFLNICIFAIRFNLNATFFDHLEKELNQQFLFLLSLLHQYIYWFYLEKRCPML